MPYPQSTIYFHKHKLGLGCFLTSLLILTFILVAQPSKQISSDPETPPAGTVNHLESENFRVPKIAIFYEFRGISLDLYQYLNATLTNIAVKLPQGWNLLIICTDDNHQDLVDILAQSTFKRMDVRYEVDHIENPYSLKELNQKYLMNEVWWSSLKPLFGWALILQSDTFLCQRTNPSFSNSYLSGPLDLDESLLAVADLDKPYQGRMGHPFSLRSVEWVIQCLHNHSHSTHSRSQPTTHSTTPSTTHYPSASHVLAECHFRNQKKVVLREALQFGSVMQVTSCYRDHSGTHCPWAVYKPLKPFPPELLASCDGLSDWWTRDRKSVV